MPPEFYNTDLVGDIIQFIGSLIGLSVIIFFFVAIGRILWRLGNKRK